MKQVVLDMGHISIYIHYFAFVSLYNIGQYYYY